MKLPASLERYDVIEETVEITSDLAFRLMRVRDVNALVDAITELDPDERLPYWASLWPSAIALARHLTRSALPMQPLLELGAGLGLPSIAAAKLGHRVLATDYEVDALAFLEQNAALNGVALETRLFDLRSGTLGARFPLVVGSDLLYEARQVEPLAAAAEKLLSSEGTLLLADPRRPHLSNFQRVMIERGFTLTEYPHDEASICQFVRTT